MPPGNDTVARFADIPRLVYNGVYIDPGLGYNTCIRYIIVSAAGHDICTCMFSFNLYGGQFGQWCKTSIAKMTHSRAAMASKHHPKVPSWKVRSAFIQANWSSSCSKLEGHVNYFRWIRHDTALFLANGLWQSHWRYTFECKNTGSQGFKWLAGNASALFKAFFKRSKNTCTLGTTVWKRTSRTHFAWGRNKNLLGAHWFSLATIKNCKWKQKRTKHGIPNL